MSYSLSILVDGPGTDPNHRSHWAFALHQPNSPLCNLLQVLVIDPDNLIYGFDKRTGVEIQSSVSEGLFTIASLTTTEYTRADNIISQEPPPRNGKDRCQDWILNCVVALEIEEVVPAGTSELVGGLVGESAASVASKTGRRWMQLPSLQYSLLSRQKG